MKPITSCGVYFDWDNVWGGILDFFSIKYDPKSPTLLFDSQKQQVEKFITDLAVQLHTIFPDIRFIKAFADFDRLPYASSFSPSITEILYNAEIEPHPSFVRAGKQKLKDASDRSLMLESVEDIFFTKKGIDCVIIGSGDVDFYPLITFIREHSDKTMSLLSFKGLLSDFYKKISYLKVQLIDDLMSHHKTSSIVAPTPSSEATTTINSYDEFKTLLIRGLENWRNKKGLEVKTGLVVTSWVPRWGLSLTSEEVNTYFQRLKDDKIIDIVPLNPSNPLQGKIKLIK